MKLMNYSLAACAESSSYFVAMWFFLLQTISGSILEYLNMLSCRKDVDLVLIFNYTYHSKKKHLHHISLNQT